jgi:hypothetical protein
MLPARVGRGAPDGLPVEDRGAGGQNLAHRGLDGLRVQKRQGLAGVPAHVLGGRQAIDTLQRRIDGGIPQICVHHGQPDGGLGNQPGGQRQVPLDPAQCRLAGRQAEGIQTSLLVLQPHAAEFHQPGAAVPVPYGKDSGPASLALDDLVEQPDHQLQVFLVDQQPAREPAQRLNGGIAEEVLGLRTPQHDPPVRVQHDSGDSQHIQQTTRLGRRSLRLRGVVREGFGCAHPCSFHPPPPPDVPVATRRAPTPLPSGSPGAPPSSLRSGPPAPPTALLKFQRPCRRRQWWRCAVTGRRRHQGEQQGGGTRRREPRPSGGRRYF